MSSWCFFLPFFAISEWILRSKSKKMLADNDNVELGPQIATPSSPAPSSGQPTTPIYRPVITHNFPLPILMKCCGDIAGNWDFSSSNGAIMRWQQDSISDKNRFLERLCVYRWAENAFQILLNLNLGRKITRKSKAVRILGKLIQAQQNLVYKRYVLIRV